ncbi:MAG: VacJ family lipoprotein [Proteobacteria bacterium]|nr:VacJ family lipoprotein [Pseudomonadota bacterium]
MSAFRQHRRHAFRTSSRLALALALLFAAGCATTSGVDPWEKSNRKVFEFNEGLDRYALEPVAKGWDWVVPEWVQTGIRNIFDHANRPLVMMHNLLQGKPYDASVDLVRFTANTIFGLGGLIDVASMDGIARNDEDWGQTLGVWGVPEGNYVMLPLFGPSTVRQAVGLAADSFSAPYSYYIPIWGSVAATGTRLLNVRAFYLDEIQQSREDAFDYYLFMRDAYLQNLASKMSDSTELESEDEDDLYYFDDEEY